MDSSADHHQPISLAQERAFRLPTQTEAGTVAGQWNHVERPMNESMEAGLLANVAKGDTEAFGQLYDRFAHVLFSLAVRILRDTAAAEDVVQEVFLQIWEKASAYDPQLGRPLTWAVTLARNRAIDRLRASQCRQRLLDATAEEQAATKVVGDPPENWVLREETARMVRGALAKLAPEQRQAIELAFFGGMSQTEIAAAMHTPLGTIKARIRRGMLELRESLEAVL